MLKNWRLYRINSKNSVCFVDGFSDISILLSNLSKRFLRSIIALVTDFVVVFIGNFKKFKIKSIVS